MKRTLAIKCVSKLGQKMLPTSGRTLVKIFGNQSRFAGVAVLIRDVSTELAELTK